MHVCRAQGSNVFAGKHGFITPRDLFKWAGRGAVGYQELAENGFLLLGERLRQPAERAEVQAVLEATMNVKVRPPCWRLPALSEESAAKATLPQYGALASAECSKVQGVLDVTLLFVVAQLELRSSCMLTLAPGCQSS